MKLSPSTKIAIGFAALIAGGYAGYNVYASYAVDRLVFADLKPGRANLVAVSPGMGYKIIVANQIAQLAELKNQDFGAPDPDTNAQAEEETTNRRRIPIREMLQALQGSESALSTVVMSLNEIKDSRLPPVRVLWSAADVRKAIEGDPALKKKLERDLNIGLDGRPPAYVDLNALENGIVLQNPVPVRVRVGSEEKTLVATVLEPYLPRLMDAVTQRYAEKPDPTPEMIKGFYLDECRKAMAKPDQLENVAESLKARTDPNRLKEYAKAPERLLSNTKVIVNESFIESASYRGYDTSNGKRLFDISIRLTDEGRKRLWQYSRGRTGFQLLFIVDGIAIAAPRITHELSQREVVISQLPDESLVKDAVQTMNQKP